MNFLFREEHPSMKFHFHPATAQLGFQMTLYNITSSTMSQVIWATCAVAIPTPWVPAATVKLVFNMPLFQGLQCLSSQELDNLILLWIRSMQRLHGLLSTYYNDSNPFVNKLLCDVHTVTQPQALTCHLPSCKNWRSNSRLGCATPTAVCFPQD